MASSLIAPPAGRRDRQKLERERRILRAAEKLFARKGYAPTAMDDVARRAGLAVGTIYNYFPSKPELLLAIVRRETAAMVARGREVLDRPSPDPVTAVCALADLFLDDFTRDDRRLWRELFAAAIADPATVGRRVFESDLQLVAQLAALLDRFKTRGILAFELESLPAATVLYGVAFTWLIAYLLSDDITPGTVRSEIRRGCEIVIRGLMPSPNPGGPEAT